MQGEAKELEIVTSSSSAVVVMDIESSAVQRASSHELTNMMSGVKVVVEQDQIPAAVQLRLLLCFLDDQDHRRLLDLGVRSRLHTFSKLHAMATSYHVNHGSLGLVIVARICLSVASSDQDICGPRQSMINTNSHVSDLV